MDKRTPLFSDEGTPLGADERPPTILQRTIHYLSGRDRRLITTYLRETPIPKLQVGAGENIQKGWLNTNYWFPLHEGSILLDATRQFPFQDASFDFVYTEHMIEHVDYPQALSMLRECIRVLRPGGYIRVSTPDLMFLVGLLSSDPTATQRDYIPFGAEGLAEGVPATPVTVLNNFVRAWGHSFIYDESTLAALLRTVGFTDVSRAKISDSQHEPFRNMDHVQRMPLRFLELESMILEARKPN